MTESHPWWMRYEEQHLHISRPKDALYFKLWFCYWRLKHIQGILSRHTLSTQALESEHKVQTKKNLPKPNDYKPAGENIELIIKSHSDLRTVWILLAILPFTGQFERPRLCPKELCSDGLFQELQWDQTAQNSERAGTNSSIHVL